MAYATLPHRQLLSKPLQHPSTQATTLFTKISIKNSQFIIHIINPIELSFNVSFANFKPALKARPRLAAHSAVLSSSVEENGEVEERERKRRVEWFAEKIGAIPDPERPKFVETLIERHGGLRKISSFNDLMTGLLMVQDLNLALKLFDEMPLHGVAPDWWTYSILIRYYCRKREPEEGRKMLDRMIENGFRPNGVTLTILVYSFCSRGKIQKAIEVLELMGRFGCKPNVYTYNSVLKGLCFVGRVEEACKMLMDLKTKRDNGESISPDIYSYAAVMDGLCKVGRSPEAIELLNEAIALGLTPNAVTYNALFAGYCKEGKPKKGFRLLKQMKERDCAPDYICYSTLLHGLLKWGEVMAALWVYNQMLEVGFKVDERMMNTLLRALCRKSWADEGLLKSAYQVYDKMKSGPYAIYPDTYYLVIHTFCIGKEIDNALVTMNEMVAAGHFPRMVTINRIIHGLCKEGRINEAISVLVLQYEASRIPSKISYNILIDELSRQGHLLGASSIYGSALKLGATPHKLSILKSKAEEKMRPSTAGSLSEMSDQIAPSDMVLREAANESTMEKIPFESPTQGPGIDLEIWGRRF
ncbi:hypothetical protein Cgig2_010658 [Carnegiea gigantea]|uniref:Pentatricopeptide repeat-containing protein n=1 Tax=Carnegiea gigantea TaxID=171969 RepID=A0A9Q1JIP3_9CARY|nr:hypothetical protein Cgig2_010658 [Carnegiea gigantea]